MSDFGKVRPRERGEFFRLDFRPFGWVTSLQGEPLTEEMADGILRAVRLAIGRGTSPADAVRPHLPKSARPNLVRERYADWLKFKQLQVDAGERSPRTVQEYVRYARPGGELAWWGAALVGEIDTDKLEEWSLWMAGRGLSAKTRGHVLGAFRTFCSWLRRKRDLLQIPEFPRHPRGREHQPTIISDAEQNRILVAIPEKERGPFLVLGKMGLRPGEVRALDVDDVAPGVLVVSKAMKGLGAGAPIAGTKTGGVRRLPLAPDVADWLERHPPAEKGPLFVNPRTGKRWSHWALRERWLAAAKAVGVKVGFYEGTKHCFASEVLDKTGDERLVQEFLGHADARSTRLYAKLRPARLAEVVRPREPARRAGGGS